MTIVWIILVFVVLAILGFVFKGGSLLVSLLMAGVRLFFKYFLWILLIGLAIYAISICL